MATAENEYDLTHLTQPPVEESATPPEPEAPSTTPAVETPEQKAPVHPDYLVHQARLFGVTDEQLQELSSNQLHNFVVQQASRHAMLEAQDARRVDEHRNEPVVPKQPPSQETEEDYITYLRDELRMDPKAIALFQAQSKRLKELEGKAGEIEKRETTRQMRTTADACEAAIEELGSKYEPFLGKGDLASLSQNSDEVACRRSIYAGAGIDENVDSHATIKRKFMKQAQRIYGKAIPPDAPKAPEKPANPYAAAPKNGNGPGKKPAVTEEEWDQGALATPTNRKPKPHRGEEAAREAVRSYYREHNISDESDDEQLRNVPD